MGYYTDYELDFNEGHYDSNEIMEKLGQISDYDWDGDFLLYDMKWYSHDEDMKKLSSLYPEILFTLEGNGEENGDVWRAYYLGGKGHTVRARTMFEPFDKSKLK